MINPLKTLFAVAASAGLLLTACAGEVEFEATDAAGIVRIFDAAFTEESGMQGFLGPEVFTQADVDEFNELAEDACADLANGFDAEDYAEFEAGVLEGADEVLDFIDPLAMTVAMIDETCPTYSETLTTATGA